MTGLATTTQRPMAPAQANALAAMQAKQPPVREVDTLDLTDMMAGIIVDVALSLGHNRRFTAAADASAAEKREVQMELLKLAGASAQMIQESFGSLNITEVRQALGRGASGAYDKLDATVLLAVPTFRRWLTAYSEGVRREVLQLVEAKAPELRGQFSELPEHHAGTIGWRVGYIVAFVFDGCRIGDRVDYPLAADIFRWLWTWGVNRAFYPDNFRNVDAWWEHLLKSTAGRLRSQYAAETNHLGQPKRAGDVQRLTQLLKTGDWQEGQIHDIRPLANRAAAAAWAEHTYDPDTWSREDLRDYLIDQALQWAATLPA